MCVCLGRPAGRASASSALPPPSSRRVVNKCGAVSQTAARLQQEETGLNRREQLPTAAPLGSHYAFTVRHTAAATPSRPRPPATGHSSSPPASASRGITHIRHFI